MPRIARRNHLASGAANAIQPLEPRLLFDAQHALLTRAPSPAATNLLTVNVPLAAATASVTSKLWGAAGERWSPAGRLIDYSYAGYHSGDDPIPTTYATSHFRTRLEAAARADLARSIEQLEDRP